MATTAGTAFHEVQRPMCGRLWRAPRRWSGVCWRAGRRGHPV